MIAASYS